jgi:hypothetical protein
VGSSTFHLSCLACQQALLSLALCLSACGASSGGKTQATVANAGPDRSAAAPPSALAAAPSVRDVAAALRSSDAARAVDLLMGVLCIPDTDVVDEIRQAWIDRDSFASNQAMHDGLVRTYAAKCVVVSSQSVATDPVVRNSAAAQLRDALIGPSARAARTAMLGMHVIATNEDIETIATLAVQKPELAVTAASTLSGICGASAVAAVKRIVTFYEGNSLSQELNAVVSQQQRARASICGVESGQPGAVVSPNLPMLPGAPDASKTRDALTAKTRADAVKTLLVLRCSSDTSGALDEILRAWQDRDSPRAAPNTRDPLVRAIMAKCILWSNPHSGASEMDRAAAAELLRSAIRSDDPMTVIVSMEGLARTSLQSDLMSIAEVPQRLPAVRTPALWDVSLSCAPNPEAALAELRSTASTSAERETVDATFRNYAPNRSRLCANQ